MVAALIVVIVILYLLGALMTFCYMGSMISYGHLRKPHSRGAVVLVCLVWFVFVIVTTRTILSIYKEIK